MNVINTGRRGSGETIVLSKRRVPCGIETGKVNITYELKRKEKKKRKKEREKIILQNRNGLRNHSIAVATLI